MHAGLCGSYFRSSKKIGKIMQTIIMILFWGTLRVGEAKNPGPEMFCVGTGNPTGLLHKGNLVSTLPKGVWGMAETHLTDLGLRQFQKELQINKGTYTYTTSVVAPKLSSSLGSIGGKACGVGILSAYPCRNIPSDWDQETISEARICVGAAYVNQLWIKCGVLYGYSKVTNNQITLQRNDQLLAKLVQRIAFESHGPRILVGDFNHTHGTLPHTNRLIEAGFVELQQYALQTWNKPIQVTCKGSTTKDFVWISQELIPMLRDVIVDATWFADHSIVYGKFEGHHIPKPIPIWRKPHPLQWEECTEIPDISPKSVVGGDSDSQIQEIMQTMELAVDLSLRQSKSEGLVQSQKGRCQTQKEKWCKHPLQPPKVGRKHDPKPEFMGENMTHVRWLRQLRRLNDVVRVLGKQGNELHRLEHLTHLWTAVKQAPGFKGGFRQAWVNRAHVECGDPVSIPSNLPSLECAIRIRDTFALEFRAFEKSLIRNRIDKAKSLRVADSHRVYKDVSKPRPLPVQTLVTKRSTIVTWVSPEGDKCHYHPETLQLEGAVSTSRGMLDIQTHTVGELVLGRDQHVEVGDLLLQDQWLGDNSEIFKEFANMWTPMWQKHDHVSPDKWENFVDKCVPLLPSVPDVMPCEDITIANWDSCVKSKKKQSAIGPDGVSRLDLIKMQPACKQALVQLINQIELGLPWPRAVMTGLISSLEKHERAQTVKDYRPICIFSIVYRVWASLRARDILRWLLQFLPEDLIGSCPKKQAGDLWYAVSEFVEYGNHFDESCCGALADLSKCFNNIPRIPVFVIAKKLGVPDRLCRPWQQALISMERRFSVTGCVSQAHRSSCGFPEGDPLSVVAMVLINVALDKYVKSQAPTVRCWTYVDDWQLTGESSHDVIHGMQEVESFTDMLELPMDPAKAAFWSNQAGDRQVFRQANKPVIQHGRNLGGHVSYGKALTNYTIRVRIQSQRTMWTWLKRSVAPVFQKILTLAVVAWPRCLHGAFGTPLGQDNLSHLRTRGMQALQFDHPGANPMLQLGCVCPPRTDPGYYLVKETVFQFRRFCNPDLAFPLLDYLCQCVPSRARPGPCGVFLNRLQEIGWCWMGGGNILDHELLSLHIFKTPIQVLVSRIQQAWWAKVGSTVSSRLGFQGLENLDVPLTISKLQDWPDDQKGLLQVVLNGTYYTRDRQFHSGVYADKQCPWCRDPDNPVEDSIFHRHWICPKFQSSRDKIPTEAYTLLSDCPECSLNHGWGVKHAAAREFLHLLMQLPDLSREFFIPSTPVGPLHLFTDGSCIHPSTQTIRLATWGVTMANLASDAIEEFSPIAQGPVPGIHQTIFRGEVWAAIAACRFALRFRVSFWLWCDNQQLVDFIKLARLGSTPPTIHDKDHDLLGILHQLVCDACTMQCFEDVVKIRSHEDESQYSDAIVRWAIRGNDSADAAASRARQGYTQHFVAVWETLVRHHRRETWLRDNIHAHFIRVGLEVVAMKSSVRAVGLVDETTGQDEKGADESEVPISSLGFDELVDFRPSVHLTDFAHTVVTWLTDLMTADDAELQWVTSYQLLVDFQNFSGLVGIQFLDRHWKEIPEWSVASGYEFHRTARWFMAYLKSLSKEARVPYSGLLMTPTSTSFKCWTRCIRMRLSAARMLRIDRWWSVLGITPVKKIGASFTKIPVISRSFLNT